MNLASKFMGQNNVQKLSQAFDFANGILNATQNPQEALQKAGVSAADLTKAKALLNSPFAGMVAKACGTTKEDMMRGLSNLDGLFGGASVSPPTEQAPASELERMQANLARLK